MMRIRVFALTLILFFLPFSASAVTIPELQAQIDALLKQIATLKEQLAISPAQSTQAGNSCFVFSRTLRQGSEGADVKALQDFLYKRGYLAIAPTGYFGVFTETALQSFQAKEGIVASGSPTETGWGLLGPRTRAAIAALCAQGVITALPTTSAPPQSQLKPPQTTPPLTTSSTSAQPTCYSAPPMPTAKCSGTWQRLYDTKKCHVGWQCVVIPPPPPGNKPPVIQTISGPSSLVVGTRGSWNVVATDPESGALSYSPTWGDEGADVLLSALAGYSATSYVASSALSHTYSGVGAYTIYVSVRDSLGATTASAVSLQVIPKSYSSLESYLGVTTTPSLQGTGSAGGNSCLYFGTWFAEGTQTEGHTINDLCLATGGVCQPPGAYTPKFKCAAGNWVNALTNPYPNLQLYGNVVGSSCSANGTTRSVVVAPNTQLCRGLLCALAQNYEAIPLTCQYTNWVDWGTFSAGATTTTICAEPAPCEYGFGQSGRACAAKQNGQCAPAPYANHPLNQ